MNGLLYRLLPMILSLALSQCIYTKIDKKYEVTNKVASKLYIKDKWQGAIFYCFTLMVILIVGAVSIYVIDIPDTLYSIFGGILIGINSSIICKTLNNKIT